MCMDILFEDIKIGQQIREKSTNKLFICIDKYICEDDNYYSNIKVISIEEFGKCLGHKVPLSNIKYRCIQNGADGIENDYELTNVIWKIDKEVIINFGKDTNRRKIITLCGSTRFKDDFERVEKELTSQGNIVLTPSIYSQYYNADDTNMIDIIESLTMLADIHRSKIDMSDEIFIINKNGYIGSSTRNEIEYAKTIGKAIRYMEEL